MATSGSGNFTNTRNEIVTAALNKIGILGTNETLSQSDLQYAAGELNRMIKHWDTQGLHLWKYTEGVLVLEKDVSEYSVSSSVGRFVLESDFVATTMSATAVAGATSLTVTSTTGMAVSDVIGVVTTDDTIHWSTISTIPDSTSLTIADGLDTATASGENVYTYTSRAVRPKEVTSVRYAYKNGIERVVEDYSREDYFDLPNKSQSGSPIVIHYDPQLNAGTFYVWPTPSHSDAKLNITFSRGLEDFDAAADTPDFPQEWLRALVLNLSVELCPAYGKDNKLAILKPEADMALRQVLGWDNEKTSIFLGIDTGDYGNY